MKTLPLLFFIIRINLGEKYYTRIGPIIKPVRSYCAEVREGKQSSKTTSVICVIGYVANLFVSSYAYRYFK
jgi:hypothetical protein